MAVYHGPILRLPAPAVNDCLTLASPDRCAHSSGASGTLFLWSTLMGTVPTTARRPGARVLRLLTGATAGMLLSLSGSTGAYAFSDQVAQEFEHFFECKVLLFTNPAEHASQCLPSRVPPSFGSLLEQGSSAPKPEKVEEEEEEEQVCEGNLDGGTCYSESCTEEQQSDPFYHCFES